MRSLGPNLCPGRVGKVYSNLAAYFVMPPAGKTFPAIYIILEKISASLVRPRLFSFLVSQTSLSEPEQFIIDFARRGVYSALDLEQLNG
jgi:hypothetical protein